MSVKDKKNKDSKKKAADLNNIGIDRKTAKAYPSKKSLKEIADITFKKHEKSFEKLAE